MPAFYRKPPPPALSRRTYLRVSASLWWMFCVIPGEAAHSHAAPMKHESHPLCTIPDRSRPAAYMANRDGANRFP